VIRGAENPLGKRDEAETHVYTVEGCRTDTPAATAATTADLRVQFADLPR